MKRQKNSFYQPVNIKNNYKNRCPQRRKVRHKKHARKCHPRQSPGENLKHSINNLVASFKIQSGACFNIIFFFHLYIILALRFLAKGVDLYVFSSKIYSRNTFIDNKRGMPWYQIITLITVILIILLSEI